MSWRGPSLPLTRLTPAACSDAELRAGVRELLLARWRELLDPSWLQVARGWVDRGEESLVVVGTPGEPPGEGPAERLDLLVQVGGPAPRALHWLARALADEGGAPLRKHLEARGYAFATGAVLPSVDALVVARVYEADLERVPESALQLVYMSTSDLELVEGVTGLQEQVRRGR